MDMFTLNQSIRLIAALFSGMPGTPQSIIGADL
jgi:hypothetical protein